MKLSRFGKKYTQPSGIVQLMDDLGSAMAGSEPVCMLGGGNPGRVPAVEARLRSLLQDLANDEAAFNRVLGTYDAPSGERHFIEALAALLKQQYGWEIGPENIALTNGSQNAFFYLFNLFAGIFSDDEGESKKILLPLAPEYIGYGDLFVDGNHFIANKPRIEHHADGMFKYRVDFDTLEISDQVGAICVSRPTNPTGNVLTDREIDHLDRLARQHDIPLIIDNAYGTPFPNIIFTEVKPHWNDNTILCMSLSKFGLPGLRTGIIIARQPVIEAVASLNAIVNLAPGSLGAALVTPLVESGEILQISREVICPFYQEKALRAVEWVREEFAGYPVYIHEPEGALFLWLWFKDLPITTQTLYQRLKARKVLIIPSHHFYAGLDEPWRHKDECIRLTYSQSAERVREGIRIIGEEVRAAYEC